MSNYVSPLIIVLANLLILIIDSNLGYSLLEDNLCLCTWLGVYLQNCRNVANAHAGVLSAAPSLTFHLTDDSSIPVRPPSPTRVSLSLSLSFCLPLGTWPTPTEHRFVYLSVIFYAHRTDHRPSVEPSCPHKRHTFIIISSSSSTIIFVTVTILQGCRASLPPVNIPLSMASLARFVSGILAGFIWLSRHGSLAISPSRWKCVKLARRERIIRGKHMLTVRRPARKSLKKSLWKIVMLAEIRTENPCRILWTPLSRCYIRESWDVKI